MKKAILFTTFLFALFSYSFSQITITAADFPSMGDTSFVVGDTSAANGAIVGNSGANQTWDLLAVQTEYTDSALFVDPASLPETNDFPTANLAIIDLPRNYRIYIDISGTDVKLQGVAGNLLGIGGSQTFYNVPPPSFAQLPMNYLDNWTDTYDRLVTIPNGGLFPSNFDSIHFKTEVNKFDTIDGWGTLVTPMGVFDALRQVSYEYTSDSIFGRDSTLGWVFLSADMDSSKAFRWWTPGIGVTAEAEMDNDFVTIELVEYELKGPQVGIQEPVEALAQLNVYPNPATADTRIEYELREAGEVEITLENILGQHILTLVPPSMQPAGKNTLTPDLSNIAHEHAVVLVKMRMGQVVLVRKLLFKP